jgi:multiple antibiotic resistance protein
VAAGLISFLGSTGKTTHRDPPRARRYPRQFLAALTGMFLLCVLVWVCYGNADRLVRMLGTSGTNILTRFSALILMAIGVQIMWNGLSSGMPALFAPVVAR